MATKRPLELPRGVRVFKEAGRKKPFACQWRINGRRTSRWFTDAAARDKWAVRLTGDVRELGTAAYRLDEAEAREWRAFRAQLGDGVSLAAVLACWQRHGVERAPLTVREAVKLYLAAKKVDGTKLSTQLHYRTCLDRLSDALGNADVKHVSHEQIAEWLDGLGMSPWSRRTHFARARGLFTWLKAPPQRLIKDSPCEGLKGVRVPTQEVPILTVEQGRRLFERNLDEPPELLGRLALEAFPGLRFASAALAHPGDIDFASMGVLLPASKIKTGKREFITKLPPNLWPWLRRSLEHPDPTFIGPVTWTMTPRQYLAAKSRAFIRASVPHPKNCLRHSAGTYEVNRTGGTVGSAATMLCNSEAMIRDHYLGRATEADGNGWREIAAPARAAAR